MAFDIGQRVTSRFTGAGIILGEVKKDVEGVYIQKVLFDNPALGERDWEIGKLISLEG
jgi:hypothetical protein